MSNFKKFLALALAAMMVVGMMVFAPAASAYEPTGEYKDSIALLNAFDVMLGDGESFGEKTEVTRWQMALLIARIVTGETGNAMWEGQKSDYFTDITADHYPAAIDFCAELGIIMGVGDGKFEPESPILYQDALTMIVRLLGHETKNTTYPWGYILESRNLYYSVDENPENDVYVTEKIDTGYKKNLLREEVAELLAKMIYVPVLDASGTATRPLIETGLKCEDLGTWTLVATDTASTDESTFSKYGEVTFKNAEGETKTIKVANITKGALSLNNYLGFTATLSQVKKTTIAKMDSVDVYDTGAFTITGNTQVKIGSKTYTPLVYGTAANKVFVTNTETLNAKGRVYVCGNVARYVPINNVKALAAINVKVTKTSTQAWPETTTTPLYYEALDGEYSITANEKVVSLWGPNNKALQGLYQNGTVTNSATSGSGNRTALADVKYIESTGFRVSVDGSIINGEAFLGTLKKVGTVSFVTVVNYPDIVTGTAKFNGTGSETVKLGDTEFGVGFNSTISAVNGWYSSFADSTSFITLAGSDVDYVTVGGRVVSMKKHDGTTTPTDKKPDEYTKTPIILVVNSDGKNVVANADDTLGITTINLSTGALETVKVDQIGGVKVAKIVNEYGLAVASTMLGIEADNIGELVAGLLGAAPTTALKNGSKDAASYLVTVANKADDVYSISVAADKYTQARMKAAIDLTFKKYATSAISTGMYTVLVYSESKSTTSAPAYVDSAKYLTVTADTEILVIAQDKMGVIKGAVPADGSHLKLATDEEAGKYVFELSNNRIVIFNAAESYDDITNITATAGPITVEGGWYTLTWTTSYAGMEIVKDNDKTYYNYTFNDLYNLTTKAKESVVISSDTYYANPAESIFAGRWTAGRKTPLTATADAKVMFKAGSAAEFYRPYYITNELGSGAQVSSMISWGLANGYSVGRIDNLKANDQNTLVIKNLTVTASEGAYALAENAATDKDVDVVVDYSFFIFNQSANSVHDEIGVWGSHADTPASNTGYHGKALKNTLYITTGTKEIVLYKLDPNTGVAEIIVNFVDGLGANNMSSVSDAFVK